MMPISAVHREGFRDLVGPLAGKHILKSPTFFANLLSQLYDEQKALLITALKGVKNCSVTADCWKARNKHEYIGLTVHWKNELLERCSAMLAIRRMKGKITYLELATSISAVLKEFQANIYNCLIKYVTFETFFNN